MFLPQSSQEVGNATRTCFIFTEKPRGSLHTSDFMTSYLLSNHDRVRKKCIRFSYISDTFLIRLGELRKLYSKWSISCWYCNIFIDTLNFEQLVRNRVVSCVCVVKVLASVNFLSHIEQLCGFSPVWILLCESLTSQTLCIVCHDGFSLF